MFNIFFFENFAVYEIRWKNILERARPLMTIWGVRIAFWISKATNTYTDCVILISVLLQQRLHERASLLRYKNIACLVNIHFGTYPVKQKIPREKVICVQKIWIQNGCS